MKYSSIKFYRKQIEALQIENEKLKSQLRIYGENERIKSVNETLKRKKEYESLIRESLAIKAEYEKLLDEQRKINKEYQDALNKALKSIQ